jgi:hypothetical protein
MRGARQWLCVDSTATAPILSGRSASGSSVNAAVREKPCQGASHWHEMVVSEQLTACQVMAEASACSNIVGEGLQRGWCSTMARFFREVGTEARHWTGCLQSFADRMQQGGDAGADGAYLVVAALESKPPMLPRWRQIFSFKSSPLSMATPRQPFQESAPHVAPMVRRAEWM